MTLLLMAPSPSVSALLSPIRQCCMPLFTFTQLGECSQGQGEEIQRHHCRPPTAPANPRLPLLLCSLFHCIKLICPFVVAHSVPGAVLDAGRSPSLRRSSASVRRQARTSLSPCVCRVPWEDVAGQESLTSWERGYLGEPAGGESARCAGPEGDAGTQAETPIVQRCRGGTRGPSGVQMIEWKERRR